MKWNTMKKKNQQCVTQYSEGELGYIIPFNDHFLEVRLGLLLFNYSPFGTSIAHTCAYELHSPLTTGSMAYRRNHISH